MSSSSEAIELIERAVTRFIEEVPALAPLKLVVGLELRGRGDVQQFRVELPGPKVTKAIAADAKVRIEMPRAFFNAMAKAPHVAHSPHPSTSPHPKATTA